MADYFMNIILGSRIEPTEPVQDAFNRLFSEVVNVEWFIHEGRYEVIFYQNEVEKIARFEQDGRFVDVRENLGTDSIPEKILPVAESQGEIMNCILISKGQNNYYEFILRDRDLRRFTLLMDEEGDVLSRGYL